MKYKLVILFLFISISTYATGNTAIWGQTGHRVVGEIAYSNLTNKAKRNIEKLLNGEGLAIISTYADEIKSDKKYREFGTWHYVNFKDGESYETSEKNPKGDLIQGIKKCQEVISNPDASKEEKIFYVKLLVHLLGDLHQPLHIGR